MTRLIALLLLVLLLAGFGVWLWQRGQLDFIPAKVSQTVEKARSVISGGAKGSEWEDLAVEAGSGSGADPVYLRLREAASAAGDGELARAREILRGLIADPSAAGYLPTIKTLLGEVNLTLLLEPGEGPGKVPYVVQAGDAIARIAARTGAPAELIVRANNLQGLTIRKGDTLHIPVVDAAVVIYLRHAVLQVYDGENFLKEYPVREIRLPQGVKAPIETAVAEKISSRRGERVAFGDPAYFNAARAITLRGAGLSIYAPGADNDPGIVPGGAGFRLDPADLDEIFLLVKRGTPVQILEK